LGGKKKKKKKQQKPNDNELYWRDRLEIFTVKASRELRSILNSIGELDQMFINACIEDFNELISSIEDNILAYHLNNILEEREDDENYYCRTGSVYYYGSSSVGGGREEEVESSKVREW